MSLAVDLVSFVLPQTVGPAFTRILVRARRSSREWEEDKRQGAVARSLSRNCG